MAGFGAKGSVEVIRGACVVVAATKLVLSGLGREELDEMSTLDIIETSPKAEVANMLFSAGGCMARVVASWMGELEVVGCKRFASRATSSAESSMR